MGDMADWQIEQMDIPDELYFRPEVPERRIKLKIISRKKATPKPILEIKEDSDATIPPQQEEKDN